jgi:chorismate--pyruvate lyase
MKINNLALCQNKKPPDALLPWLTHQQALTTRLKMHTGDAKVQVIKQEWASISWWEKYVLELSLQQIYRREIMMTSHQKPCWYARTLIPEKSYHQDSAFFARLEKEALTTLIYGEPRVERLQLFYYSIDNHCLEFYWTPYALQAPTWVRFSGFVFLKQYEFYLVEIFYPEGFLTI